MFDEETRKAIAIIASKLDVPTAALLAVAQVESGGRLTAKVRGKDEPLIRFEGHYFDRFLRGNALLEARAEGLANPKAGAVKNPRSQSGRWKMLNRAIKINRTAAMSSTSWGLGQVMGAHWEWLGYGSVDALVFEARSGPVGQVALMAKYIKKAKLIKALQESDWVAFARTYNGPSFRRNRYDERMAAAFIKLTLEAGDKAQSTLPLTSTIEQPEDLKNAAASQKLMFGSRGPLVKELQRALTSVGYVLVADGLYGLVTDRVVRQFQRDHLIPENGIFDSQEKALLAGNGSKIKTAALSLCNAINQRNQSCKKLAKSKLKAGLLKVRHRIRRGLLSISKRMA